MFREMASQMIRIKIQNDYNEYTGPRYCSQGTSLGKTLSFKIE